MKTIRDLQYSKLDWLVAGAIFAPPIFFMTVRHAVHIPLFFLLLLTIYQGLTKTPAPFRIQTRQDVFIFFVFSSLFLAALISQLFRGAIHFAAFDGPFRLMVAGVAFLYLRQWNIPYIKILGVAIPLGLIFTFIALKIHPGVASWGGRYAIYFVDPNTLGSQSFILGLLSLLMIRSLKQESIYLFLLKLIGGLVGLYISVGSGSRGAWLTAPFILTSFFIITYGDAAIYRARGKKSVLLELFAISIFATLILISSLYFSSTLGPRIVSGYVEVHDWFTGENLQSSAGDRLSMWKFSFEFAKQSLLFGYGEEKNMLMTLKNSSLNIPANQVAIITMAGTGPHSDILSKLLSAGIIGLAAYFLVLLVPSFIFWKTRNSKDTNKKIASRIGIYYTIGIFIAGLSNEQLSLKYLCTFYGLMIATLLAQALYQSTVKNHNPLHG